MYKVNGYLSFSQYYFFLHKKSDKEHHPEIADNEHWTNNTINRKLKNKIVDLNG